MTDLKACPFCGGTEIKLNGTQRPYWYAECQKCGVSDGLCHTKDEAHKSWNTRANDKGGEAVAELMKTNAATGWHVLDNAAVKSLPVGTHKLYTHPPRATAIKDIRKDAEEWGTALNAAAWVFIEECPEKSALLFNTAKETLRSAILKYLDVLSAKRGD